VSADPFKDVRAWAYREHHLGPSEVQLWVRELLAKIERLAEEHTRAVRGAENWQAAHYAEHVRADALAAALRQIKDDVLLEYREGDRPYQYAILAVAALAAPSTEPDAKVWGPERMRHDPERGQT
jgi:hypothetical protein